MTSSCPSCVLRYPANRSSTRISRSQRRARDLPGRIGVSEAAADRPPVPYPHVADVPGRGAQQGRVAADRRVGEQLRVPGQGRKHQAAGVQVRLARVSGVDVDEHGGPDQPQVQHRHQALPAGQQLGVLVVVGQGLHGRVVADHPGVLERRRNHDCIYPLASGAPFGSVMRPPPPWLARRPRPAPPGCWSLPAGRAARPGRGSPPWRRSSCRTRRPGRGRARRAPPPRRP